MVPTSLPGPSVEQSDSEMTRAGGGDGRGRDSGAVTTQAGHEPGCRSHVNTSRNDTGHHADESKFQPQCNYPPGEEGSPLLGQPSG